VSFVPAVILFLLAIILFFTNHYISLGIVIAYIFACMRIIQEYDRFVVFTLGRVTGAIGPGLQFVWIPFQATRRVGLRITTMDIPTQDIITKDNISVQTSAVCFFRVMDPLKVVIKIQDPLQAINQIAQTTLRSVVGQHELDELLSNREAINAKLKEIIDRQTEDWGIQILSVEIKDVTIPENMKRAIAQQAEAERERRAKIVSAQGEFQASEKLAQAAKIMMDQPGTMQLRQLQTLLEISVEKNSTIVFPLPIDLLTVLHEAAKASKQN
jgi:regulator of protease activity HflC (stomatin/prohibitin superfamily)